MKIRGNENQVVALADAIAGLYQRIAYCREEVERIEEVDLLVGEMAELCGEGLEVVRETGEVGLLVALMDAYEITRDEGMLQEVLDVAGRNAERMLASPEGVRLYCYCYYYTEDEECGELARGMLERLDGNEEGYAEVLEVFREMVGEF